MVGLEGTRLGEYQIVRRIGGGGMGDVYLAEHTRMNRLVAIKTLRDGAALGLGSADSSGRAVERFEQEARVIARLEHPHIVRIYDYGADGALLYMVMAYVPDGSLYTVLDLRAPSAEPRSPSLPLAPRMVTELTRQMADALDYAHDMGVVHCDVKPQNILVRRLSSEGETAAVSVPLISDASGVASFSGVSATGAGADGPPGKLHLLLTDFGLARILSELTSTVTISGTPLYMAPEQATGHPVPATDQYSLACLVYLLLTGRHVFQGNLAQLHYQHLQIEPTPPTRIHPGLPPAVDTVLQRALSKFPEQRYARVGDFAQALEAAITGVSAARLAPQTLLNLPSGDTAQPSYLAPSPQTAPPAPSLQLLPSHPSHPSHPSGGGYLAIFGAPSSASGASSGTGAGSPNGPAAGGAYGSDTGAGGAHLSATLPGARDAPGSASDGSASAMRTAAEPGESRMQVISRRALLAGVGMFGAAAIVGGSALVARQYGWPFAQGASSQPQLRWRYEVGAKIFSSPVVGNRAVYFGADSNDLYALNTANGHPLWSFSTRGAITATPASANNLIYAASQDGNLYALDAKTGFPVWTFAIGRVLGASPVVDGQLLYQPVARGVLVALDASNGSPFWTYRSPGSQYSTAALGNDLVCYGAMGAVLALDAISGVARWRYAGQHDELFARPLLVGDTLFVGSHSGQFYVLDAITGKLRSQIPLPGAVLDAPVLAGESLYVSTEDGELFALRVSDGELGWRFSANGRITHAPAVVNGIVYVGSYDYNVYALDAINGKLRWRYTCSGPIGAIPAVTQDSLYVTSADGAIYALTLPGV